MQWQQLVRLYVKNQIGTLTLLEDSPTKLSNLGQEKNEAVYCELMALIKSSIVTFIKGLFMLFITLGGEKEMSLVSFLFLKGVYTLHLWGMENKDVVNLRILPVTKPLVVLETVTIKLFKEALGWNTHWLIQRNLVYQ